MNGGRRVESCEPFESIEFKVAGACIRVRAANINSWESARTPIQDVISLSRTTLFLAFLQKEAPQPKYLTGCARE
jgi:hypothetical protein